MAPKRGKLRKKHWLGVEILIIALIVFLALNLIQFPVTETETYIDRVPYERGEMRLVEAPYNETTCTKRDYEFELEQNQIVPLQGNSAAFMYTVENKENREGTFEYQLGMTSLYAARLAVAEGRDIVLDRFTEVESIDIPARTSLQVIIPIEGLKASDPYYGDLIIFPPQLEECTTEEKMTEVEVPATETDFREVERTREVIRYETLWERVVG